MRDRNSKAEFYYYTISATQNEHGDGWVGVCLSCAKEHELAEERLHEYTKHLSNYYCGVDGCSNKADRYYIFHFAKNGEAIRC